MKVVDLFAGCGGLSLGFQNAGFDIVAAYDSWQPAVNVYRDNFTSHSIYQMDLSEVDAAVRHIAPFAPAMIIGGPPCQDFSHAGKRQEGMRASLTEVYAQIVSQISPEWFVMENVDRAQKSEAYKNARKILKNVGYGLTEHVYDASLCGVPQKRKRFICVGKKDVPDGFLSEYILANESKTPMTMRDYFGNKLGIDYYYRHPRNYSRRGFFSMDEPSPTVRGVNRPIPHSYTRHPGDPESIEGLRPLTTAERAQVQTFPENFNLNGSKTDLEQLIGNAVPVKLAEFVASLIVDYRARENESRFEQLRDWLVNIKEMTPVSAKDVLSRINRILSITPITHSDTAIDVNYRLAKSELYNQLSPTVRSQIKRAVTLYFEFAEQQNNRCNSGNLSSVVSAEANNGLRQSKNVKQEEFVVA
ncbi:MAG: DNA cytosine methyltransferase [Victivallaceae bacterium]|nr:DNA cytosine methyltransferase [Victivallaceae bacterium]